MKNFLSYFLILLFVLAGCNNSNNETSDNNQNLASSNVINTNKTNIINSTDDSSNIESTYQEENLASFSTKIYTPNDEARQNNIKITCSKLDGAIVKSRRNIFIL